MLDALRSLREAGLKLGALTDGIADPLTIDGLSDLLDFCVTAREAGALKPDPRPFALCEQKAGCGPADLVMVGDNAERDVEGARRAGWRAIWKRPPSSGPAYVGSAFDISGDALDASGERHTDAVIDHVSEVAPILRAWAAESMEQPLEAGGPQTSKN